MLYTLDLIFGILFNSFSKKKKPSESVELVVFSKFYLGHYIITSDILAYNDQCTYPACFLALEYYRKC